MAMPAMAVLAKLVVIDPTTGKPATGCSATIVKQSSGVFRVNPTEHDNPATYGLDLTNQYDPAVAMDADGDFIVTWTNTNANGTTDIYARRFEAQAYVANQSSLWNYQDYSSTGVLTTTYVQSVRPCRWPARPNPGL